MSQDFNLIDRGWIPCLMTNGRMERLGLRDVLFRAHEIQEIIDPSPLVTVSLHRLLLAILHRNFGPKDHSAWKAMWQAGRWDTVTLDDYFNKWRDRFDLLNERYPFFQLGGFKAKAPSPVNRLAPEIAGGNNATLFDHSLDSTPRPISLDQAARLLVAHQSFALGGLAGGGQPNFRHAPLLQGMAVMLQGDSLFQTLMLNMVRYSVEHNLPFVADENDLPLWERGNMIPLLERQPHGYLDLLTWPSRGLLLRPSDDGNVAWVDYSYGEIRPEEPSLRDPCMAFKIDEKRGVSPIRLREERELWRDSGALFRAVEKEHLPPSVCEWAAELLAKGVLKRSAVYRIAVFGLCSDQAKVNFWRHERLPLPMAYLDDENLYFRLRDCLILAEHIGTLLQSSCWSLAKRLLSSSDEASLKKEVVSKLADSFSAPKLYWSSLEVPFRRLLVDLPGNVDVQEDLWRNTMSNTAKDAWESMINGLDRSARAMQAAVHSSGYFFSKLKNIIPSKEVEHG